MMMKLLDDHSFTQIIRKLSTEIYPVLIEEDLPNYTSDLALHNNRTMNLVQMPGLLQNL